MNSSSLTLTGPWKPRKTRFSHRFALTVGAEVPLELKETLFGTGLDPSELEVLRAQLTERQGGARRGRLPQG